MEERSPRVPAERSKGRFAAVDDGGDPVECSGKYCRSCTAGMIADCVALCCCPCAVLHCFALAFIKAPWMMGRRCLGLGKKKKKMMMMKNKGVRTKRKEDDVVLERKQHQHQQQHQRSELGNLRKGWVEEGMLEIMTGFGETEEMGFEAEKAWIEMYQIGHLGFFHRELN